MNLAEVAAAARRDLTPSERALIEGAGSLFAEQLPRTAEGRLANGALGAAPVLHGSFLRLLLVDLPALGLAPLPSLRLRGVVIRGDLDLKGARDLPSLELVACLIAGTLDIAATRVVLLDLHGSEIAGLSGEGAELFGDLRLRGGFANPLDAPAAAQDRVLDGLTTGLPMAVGALDDHDSLVSSRWLDECGLDAGGDLRAVAPFVCTGPIHIDGMEVRGDLDLSGCHLPGGGAATLEARGLRVRGSLLFDRSIVERVVTLENASIEGDLRCLGFTLKAAAITSGSQESDERLRQQRRSIYRRAQGLSLVGARIGGRVLLERAVLDERVRATNARIGSDFDLTGLRFVDRSAELGQIESGLILTNAQVGEKLCLMGLQPAPNTILQLLFTHVRQLLVNRDPVTWVAANEQGNPGRINLYGLTYSELSNIIDERRPSPAEMAERQKPLIWRMRYPFLSAARRREDRRRRMSRYRPTSAVLIAFLERDQPRDDSSRDQRFKPQPYRQMAQVVMAEGYHEEGLDLLVEMEGRIRENAWRGFPRVRRKARQFADWMLFWTIDYGYRPLKAFWALLWVLLPGVVIFLLAYRFGLLGIRQPDVYASDLYAQAGALPFEYPEFNAFLYAIDTLIPVLDLGQEVSWGPVGKACLFRSCTELADYTFTAGRLLDLFLNFVYIPLGWVLSTLFFVGLSGLTKSRPDN